MTDRVEELERYLEFLHLITKTFASLSLHDRESIADTLLSLALTFVDAEKGLVTFAEEIAASRGVDPDAAAAAGDALRTLADGKVTQLAGAAQLGMLGASDDAPFAAIPLVIRDEPVGLVVIGAPRHGSFSEAALSFLTAVGGVGSLAIANADSLTEVATNARVARTMAADLDRKVQLIETQNQEIRELSSPILEVWAGVLAVPIIGRLDDARQAEIGKRLLDTVSRTSVTDVVLDLTGLDVGDAPAVSSFVRLVEALRLLGVRPMVTGIRPSVAQALTSEGNLAGIQTHRTLAEALRRVVRV
jgi:anti-anti-sigma regulatory factor